jgi:hypothetical protein
MIQHDQPWQDDVKSDVGKPALAASRTKKVAAKSCRAGADFAKSDSLPRFKNSFVGNDRVVYAWADDACPSLLDDGGEQPQPSDMTTQPVW